MPGLGHATASIPRANKAQAAPAGAALAVRGLPCTGTGALDVQIISFRRPSVRKTFLDSMNGQAFHYKYSIQDSGGVHSPAVPEIIRRLNRMPKSAIKVVFPIEALKARIQATAK